MQLETGDGRLALLGASGCGKPVTLRCVAGILTPDEGKIVLDGVTLFDSVVTTGGTGFAPRDVTPEATISVCERLVPGVPEAIRYASMQPWGMLPRAQAGIRGGTRIINLPGSSRADQENMAEVLPSLEHGGLELLAGRRTNYGEARQG